jgi:chaperonin cofactor prefoldin
VTCSVTQGKKKNTIEERMSNLEWSVKSLTKGQQKIREKIKARMTDIFDILSTHGKS